MQHYLLLAYLNHRKDDELARVLELSRREHERMAGEANLNHF